MNITKITDLDIVTQFLEQSNVAFASYHYKIPLEKTAKESYLQDIMQNDGIYAFTDTQHSEVIRAVIFGFAYEPHKYKVVGPFITGEDAPSDDVFASWIAQFVDALDSEATYNFSFDKLTQTYISRMSEIDAHFTFTDYYLATQQDVGPAANAQHIVKYSPVYDKLFHKMHAQTFRHDVMSAKTITDQLDDTHVLYLYLSEGLLKGYVYFEIDSETERAEIKYFTAHEDYRLMGIAFNLLRHSLDILFNDYRVKTTHFKIRSKNDKLIDRFNELGFTVNYELQKFKKTVN